MIILFQLQLPLLILVQVNNIKSVASNLFSTSTTAADPGTGKVRLNSSTQNTSTLMYLDITDDDGTSIQSFLETIDSATSAVKGHVRVAKRLDATDFILFSISNLTDNTGWWTININDQAFSSSSPFINDEDITLAFVVTGDAGTSGSSGTSNLFATLT